MSFNTSNRVLVLDKNKVPLMPCHPARARELLNGGKAAVYRRYPFTIILKDREGGQTQHTDIKIDPGTKYTGMALVALFDRGPRCIYGLHIKHRGDQIKMAMVKRAALRRFRRQRTLRYRPPRFNNRATRRFWLAPSIQHRVDTTLTWVKRLLSTTPSDKVYFEVVKFNVAALSKDRKHVTPRGRVQMRHYLLHIYNNTCQYCHGLSKDRMLEWDHVIPKSKGGSNALDNATLSCRKCNQSKGNLLLKEWLMSIGHYKDKLSVARQKGIKEVMVSLRQVTKDSTIANITRDAIARDIRRLGVELVECPAWETAYNRNQGGYCKEHWVDAACVGYYPYLNDNMTIYTAVAKGYGNRQMVASDKYGFPRGSAKGPSEVNGYRSGDIAKLNCPAGKYKGVYVGRITVRTSGNFDIHTLKSRIASKYTNYTQLHRNDGYRYTKGTGIVKITLIE